MAGSKFRTTNWGLIDRVRSGQDGADEAMERLIEIYRQPVYTWFRRQGYPDPRAEDLTQSFFAEVVIGRRLFESANRERARLRTLMKQALRNFKIDQLRRIAMDPAGAGARPGLQGVSETIDDAADPEFDRILASAMLDEALRRCEQACLESGRFAQWNAFELRVLRPARLGSQPPSYAVIADRAGLSTGGNAFKAINAVKARCRFLFYQVIAENVSDRTQCDEEANYLFSLLRT